MSCIGRLFGFRKHRTVDPSKVEKVIETGTEAVEVRKNFNRSLSKLKSAVRDLEEIEGHMNNGVK